MAVGQHFGQQLADSVWTSDLHIYQSQDTGSANITQVTILKVLAAGQVMTSFTTSVADS